MIQNSPIDLTLLPAPDVIEALDYESILAAMLADLRARHPAFDALVESDPAYKLLEVCAYRELLLRNRVNDAARSVMMAYAKGKDLDQLAGFYGVKRMLITPQNAELNPDLPAIDEDDETFRSRVLLSLEGYTTAGSRNSYRFHALSASGDVKDIGIASLEPGIVNVAVLSRTGNGAAPAATIAAVTAALNAENIRPLCDTVQVGSAEVFSYEINATLYVDAGSDLHAIQYAAATSLDRYLLDQHQLSAVVSRSGIMAALHVSGVRAVHLGLPADDVICAWNMVPVCNGPSISTLELAS